MASPLRKKKTDSKNLLNYNRYCLYGINKKIHKIRNRVQICKFQANKKKILEKKYTGQSKNKETWDFKSYFCMKKLSILVI